MFVFSNHPQSIWRIMADALNLYRDSISKIWYWQIIFILPTIPLAILNVRINPDPSLPFTPSYISFLIAAGLIMLFVLLLGHCFVYARMHAIGTGGDARIKTCLRIAAKKAPMVFMATMALALAISIIVVPTLSLLLKTNNAAIAFFGITIAYFFTLIVGILAILYPLFILINNETILGSLKSSITHMWQNFWRALTLFMFLSLICAILMLIVLVLPSNLINLAESPEALVTGLLGLLLVYACTYIFIPPVFNAILLTLYQDVRIRKTHPSSPDIIT
ncbi:MAG: hypothetical protein K0Q74_55 [Gammaproteobacteria bacterium]|jgi:hypothetical protein|nr:hypothetical protein [Gammaproteobacteria bacterium]